jgi:glyoxylase-like metal-dependent hydrolase (beta-lactamase superfamily II)
MKKPEEAKGCGAIRLFHNSLWVQLLPRFPFGDAYLLRCIQLPTVNFPVLRYTSLLMNSITSLDNLWMGRPRSIAAGLLESDGHRAVVDPGPGSTLETLRQRLQARGIGVGDLDAILLTHIHLDHAGATGALVRENPRLAVYVHKLGAPHVIDPSKLLASAARLWPNDLKLLFGEALPVPAENLRILEGGETLTLGSRKVEVVYTPGHASHHVSYFDKTEGVAFVGDTAGVRIEGNSYVMPATPPPDIDLGIWDTSFAAILERKPARLFLTHFGFSDNPSEHILLFRERLHRWAALTAEILRTAASDSAAMDAFMFTTYAEISQHVPGGEAEHYAFSAGLNLSFLGLARYLRKRATAAS